MTPSAPSVKSKFLGSGRSVVARLKLKGIDGKAPPGVASVALFYLTQHGKNSPGPDTVRIDRLKALSWICGAVPFLVVGVKLSG